MACTYLRRMISGLHSGGTPAGAKLRDSLLSILATRQSLEEIFHGFLEVLHRIVRCDRCVLYRVHDGIPEVVCGAGNGEGTLSSCPAEPVLMSNVRPATLAPPGMRSCLVMPVYNRGKLHGALELTARMPGTFFEAHVALLEPAAQILGAVMAQDELEKRLAASSQERDPQERRSKVLGEILTLWPRHMELGQIAGLLASGLEARCDIFLWDEPSRHLILGASSVDGDADVVTVPLHKGIVGQAAAFQAVLNLADVRTDPRYVERVSATVSELAVPMINSTGGLLGVINVESPNPAAFSEEDAELLAGMARFLALWMESRWREKRLSAALEESKAMAAEVTRSSQELAAIQERAHAMESRLARAEQLSALGKLVAGAAHELNNPLTVMQGYAEMLMEQPLPPAVVERLKTIHDQSRHAASIVTGLLQLSRATPPSETETGESPKQQSCDLAEVMQEAVAACAQQLAARNVVVTVKADPTLFVSAEPSEIGRLLAQLLQNAETAVSHADRKEICVSSRRVEDRAELTVTDTGTGIAAGALPQIFEPFFTTSPGFGAGLGLYLCAGIAKTFGGEIHAANRPDGGAIFTVTLPALPDVQHPARTGGTALVLTEEEQTRSLWEETLSGENWQAIAANTPEEALDKLGRNHFDLVLTDVRYPQQEGLLLRAGVKERGYHVPLLMVTGQNLDTTTRTLLEHSGCLLLGKPFRIGELREILDGSKGQAQVA